MQTAFNDQPPLGIAGQIAESGGELVRARVANGAVRPGQYVVFSGEECSHPSAAPTPGTRGGVALLNAYKQNNGVYADGDMVDVLIEGVVWVDPEDTVAADAPAFVRHAVATTEEKGAFRSNPAGVGGGVTFTVESAVNAGVYNIELDNGVEFPFIADADATLAEVATGLKNAIDAHADYVATNPTSTTILVVRAANAALEVGVDSFDARLSYVTNGIASRIPGLFYRTSGSGLVKLEVNKSAA